MVWQHHKLHQKYTQHTGAETGPSLPQLPSAQHVSKSGSPHTTPPQPLPFGVAIKLRPTLGCCCRVAHAFFTVCVVDQHNPFTSGLHIPPLCWSVCLFEPAASCTAVMQPVDFLYRCEDLPLSSLIDLQCLQFFLWHAPSRSWGLSTDSCGLATVLQRTGDGFLCADPSLTFSLHFCSYMGLQ